MYIYYLITLQETLESMTKINFTDEMISDVMKIIDPDSTENVGVKMLKDNLPKLYADDSSSSSSSSQKAKTTSHLEATIEVYGGTLKRRNLWFLHPFYEMIVQTCHRPFFHCSACLYLYVLVHTYDSRHDYMCRRCRAPSRRAPRERVKSLKSTWQTRRLGKTTAGFLLW